MIFLPSQLDNAAGRFQPRFLLACLSTGFEPTVIYASSRQLQLVNFYRAMGGSYRDCLGVCTTGASVLELLAWQKPGLLIIVDDLPDISPDELVRQVRTIDPAIRTVVFITSLAALDPATVHPILVADHDLVVHPDTLTLMSMAVVSNTSYYSPSIMQHFEELNQQPATAAGNTLHLSLRDRQLLEAYALGLSNQETAKRLGLSVRTVQTYSVNLLQRLGVNNRQKALRRAVGLGFHAVLRSFETR
jgi:two-component system response regulator FimZ (fimbrial Z protein)/two-component system response regulator EvgA